ncbi:hypothetical protein F7018_14865 [Tenacibaculum aiptasiae]|uniref:Uncharacterized protein n=1 Tax=Tenacibaculum aiptasiae TaxID=426481 RepID=A0A7J5AAP4_9FLAO|nr:hypothetical protein [Tenacibaculum aiptasiae]KAB1154249.1 hypothetical protein F7018_14865 [Tenacibaculum aiptasiae]
MSNPELKLNFIVDKNESLTIAKKIIHNKNSKRKKLKLNRNEYQETVLKWTLFKYLQPAEDNPLNSEFFPLPPSNSLNNGLSADLILKYLNSNSVFNFYKLKKNDKLNIRMEYKHPEMYRKSRPFIGDYISFIFKIEWEINKGFDHIYNSYKLLNEGIIIID